MFYILIWHREEDYDEVLFVFSMINYWGNLFISRYNKPIFINTALIKSKRKLCSINNIRTGALVTRSLCFSLFPWQNIINESMWTPCVNNIVNIGRHLLSTHTQENCLNMSKLLSIRIFNYSRPCNKGTLGTKQCWRRVVFMAVFNHYY